MIKNPDRKISGYKPWIIRTSFFCRLGDNLSVWFSKMFANSFFVGLLCSYNAEFSAKNNSYILQKLSFIGKFFDIVKKFITRLSEESKMLYLFQQFYRKLLKINTASWGIALASCGFVSALIEIFKFKTLSLLILHSHILWIGVIEILLGFLLMTMKGTLAVAIKNSAILSFVLFDLIGFREGSMPLEKGQSSTTAMVLLGITLGITSYSIPIMYLFFAITAVCGLAVIFTIPEAGVMLCFGLLPLLPTMVISALCLLVIVAYFTKLIRGKRVFRIGKLDIAVLLFAITLLILGAGSSISKISSAKTILMYLLYIAMFFIVSNTMLTKKWVYKSLSLLLVSGSISALIGLYQYFVGMESSLIWVDREMFSDITARIIGTFENPNIFGEFLIILLPIAFGLFLTKEGFPRFFSFVAFCLMGGALILSYSRGAWLGFIISFALFLVIYNNKLIKYCVLALIALIFLMPFLPSSIVNRLTSIGDMADTSTAYRVGIWIAAFKMIKTFWASGIGSGTGAFFMVYPAFALSGAGYAQHAHNLYLQIIIELGIVGVVIFFAIILYYFKMVFNGYNTFTPRSTGVMLIAASMGILAFLLQGLTDFVWYNYRIVLLFWIMMGLTSALYKSHIIEWGSRSLSENLIYEEI